MLLLEDYLEGKFTKWNNNTGGVHGPEDPVPQVILVSFIFYSYHPFAGPWISYVNVHLDHCFAVFSILFLTNIHWQ